MFQISFPVIHSDVDIVIEKLMEIGITYTYYDAPYEVTVDPNGYGFYEKNEDTVTLNAYPECKNEEECYEYINKIKFIMDINEISMTELKEDQWQQLFETIDLKNGWLIGSPQENIEGYKKINFESQGSFGTGLHETTQDLMRYILEYDFTGLSVLDLGTGSGILSVTAGIKNAKKVMALDIRDVTNEVQHNASLNGLRNIEVVVADVTSETSGLIENFDVVIINIGGEETISTMDLINTVLVKNGLLFVSGLVEWSSDDILRKILSQGYKLINKTQTNEWVTMVLKRN